MKGVNTMENIMDKIHNATEDVVKHAVEKRMSKGDICDCENCRLDVMAIMLNKLPTHYAVSDAGALYGRVKAIDFQPSVDITIAMTEAIELVNQRPRHDK
jgi:competence protein ComFB